MPVSPSFLGNFSFKNPFSIIQGLADSHNFASRGSSTAKTLCHFESVTPSVVKLPSTPEALQQHLVSEYNKAEAEASASDLSAVSSIMSIDLGIIERQYDKWTDLMPRVRPFFAVKSNPDPEIVRTLHEAGAGFDCASAHEINMARSVGADGLDDIIYANCCKFPADIAHAKSHQVPTMTFDNTDELEKIAQISPDAKCVLRIVTDDSNSVCRLSNKYGTPMCDVELLLDTAERLDLSVMGVSFHVGSGTSNPQSFAEPIKNAAKVFEQARERGIEMNLLDVGGGFPGDDNGTVTMAQIAGVINPLLDRHFPDPNVRIIAEPGRFFVHAACHLSSRVMARRLVSEESREKDDPEVLYYLGDGVYGSFNCMLFDHYVPPAPAVITDRPLSPPQHSRLFGPTCDGLDTIYESIELPLLEVGDLLLFKHMGAYTIAAASNFNGISKPLVRYIST